MTSITNMFSNLNYLTKNTSDEKNNEDNKKNLSGTTPSLNQGNKFKKYQKKIKSNLEEKAAEVSGQEGFNGINFDKLDLSADGLTNQSNNVISKNDYSSQQATIANLRKQYDNTLKEYQNLVAQISGSTTGYLDRVNPNNPYLGKNIIFTTGEESYVTQQGVIKLYTTDVLSDTVGRNGCPTGAFVPINLPWLPIYNSSGITVPSTPPLVIGTPMIKGQSCGNEGKNIFVNEMINSPNITYQGCYADNQQSPLMTFLGSSPPPPSASLQNGNFDQPQIGNDTFYYISSTSQVPGWSFNAVLINNSSAWGYPMPYPAGNQAGCIQGTQNFGQWIQINSGSYTLSFYACGRPGYNGANSINVYCIPSGQSYNAATAVNNFTPRTTAWQKYSITFNVSTSGNYAVGFWGTISSGDNSTAIQGIQLSSSGTGAGGSYTYDQCKEAAIDSEYQYFSLQGINTSTSQGYCAVSNDLPTITRLGAGMVPSGQVPLWSSKTSKQTGNSAILSLSGALSVISSSGQAVFNTPNSNANPSNYLGCYGDSSNRAMALYNGGSQQYSNAQCQQIAQQNGATYYGLQNSTSGTNAQCSLSNNWQQTSEYGKADNCTKISDGSYSGGGWSNSVYNTSLPQSNYFLILQDDGNMVIYRGTSPSDKQGVIWATMTDSSKLQSANPAYAASKGKYGKNYITQGSTLAAGDWIGSTSGNMALIMQEDGNLVLYTFKNVSNCQKMQDGNNGGGVGANSIYNIGNVGIKGNLSQLAYIDENAQLHSYPSTNTQYGSSYLELPGMDSAGFDIPGAAYGNATADSCKSSCNSNPECAGFAFNNNTCYPKTSDMYPNGTKQINKNINLYIRNKTPINAPIGVSSATNNTDTLTYGKYVNGGPIDKSYGLANATSVQKQQLSQLQTKMNLISSQITNLTTKFSNGTNSSESQSKNNVKGIDDYLTNLNKTNLSISNFSTNMDNILDDSDIVALQKNYDYLFWTILATGTVLVSMNIVKQ